MLVPGASKGLDWAPDRHSRRTGARTHCNEQYGEDSIMAKGEFDELRPGHVLIVSATSDMEGSASRRTK